MSQKYKTRPDKKKTNDKNESEERYLQFSPVSIIEIFFMAFPMLVYLYMRYHLTDPYGDFAGVLLVLGVIALAGIVILRREKIIKIQYHYLQNIDRILLFIILIFALVAALGLIWFLMGALLRYGLSTTDLYFYFIGTAIIEELFFRMFLCGTLKKLLDSTKKHFPRVAKVIAISVISGISFMTVELLLISLVSGTVFAMAHVQAYGGYLPGMISMFIGGFTFSLFYLYSEDIGVSMTAHIIVNIIAVGNLLLIIGG